jgi:Protein of unknown function (DUF4230)
MTRRKQLIALATVAAVLVLVVAIDGWLVWRHAGQTIAHIAEKKEEEVDLTSLVTRVRDLSRLETASMHVVHVGTLTQSYEMVPNALAGDEITFFATGDVIAGVDLSQLKQQDVRREPDGTITLRLPPSQILVTRLDNRESRVITRNTGVLRRADTHLESRARQYAEQGIRTEALKKGILPMASQNAEVKVGELLHTLGFRKVRFETATAPSQG